jgi:hypothetical protein
MQRYCIEGERFGRWLVLKEVVRSGKIREFFCRCDCGAEKIVNGQNLRNGKTKSCGCYRSDAVTEKNTKHGMSGTKLHGVWKNMKSRCYNTGNKDFHSYGGRGIGVCEAWLSSSVSFINWALTSGYADDLTIDRIDTNKGYSPQNCRWVSLSIQGVNKRLSRNKSGYRGVSYKKSHNKWVAQVRQDGKVTHIGIYESALEASRARINYLKENDMNEHLLAYKYENKEELK